MTGVVPVETPVSTRHERLFRFTANRYIILEAGQVVQDLPYDVKFWGEGTNAVDPVLLVHAYRSATHSSASILRIDQSGLCLELINSYGDAGGDLNLKKIDRK